MAKAYCMKCREKVEIKEPKQVTLKNRRFAIRGTCSCCGGQVYRMGR